MKYIVYLSTWSRERVIVEAANENEAAEKAMDMDDRELTDGGVSIEEIVLDKEN